MSALLALIPGKDWFYGAIFVGLAIFVWHFYDKYTDAVQYAQTVKAESKTALDEANRRIADLTTDYANKLATSEAQHAKDLQLAASQFASDTQRLQSAAAARASDPVFSGSAGLTAAIAAWSSRLGQVESISAGLADALRQDDAAAVQCWRNRDALNGK